MSLQSVSRLQHLKRAWVVESVTVLSELATVDGTMLSIQARAGRLVCAMERRYGRVVQTRDVVAILCSLCDGTQSSVSERGASRRCVLRIQERANLSQRPRPCSIEQGRTPHAGAYAIGGREWARGAEQSRKPTTQVLYLGREAR
ncbi:hypothetical protein L1887_51325 [Cichorium endivia]|nr:hypothetical protein L1887_51325 [Cichorium endivia]